MPDNFNTAYLASRNARQKPEVDAILADLDQMAASASPAPLPSPSPAAPTPAPKKSSPGFMKEALTAVGGGVLDAGRNTINAIDDAATWLDNNFLDLRMGSSTFGQVGGRGSTQAGQAAPHKESLQVPALPDYLQNKSTGGQIARSVTQFLVPFLGATKALRYAAPVMGRAGAAVESSAMARGAVAGAATDFSAFDPHEKRLSNLLVDFSDSVPALKNPLTQYLSSSPEDSGAEGRFKNTVEGLGVGMAAEGLILGAKAVKAHFWGKGTNPAEAVQTAHQEHLKDVEVPEMPTVGKEPDLTLQKQIELLTGVDRSGSAGKWQKRLDVNAAVKATPAEAGPTVSKEWDSLSPSKTPSATPEETADALLRKADTNLSLAGGVDHSGNALEFTKAAKEFPLADTFKLAEMERKGGNAYRPLLDPSEGRIVLSKEAPVQGQLDLGEQVKEALLKPKAERAANDELALRAYQDLQKAAFPYLAKGSEGVAPTATSKSLVGDSGGLAEASKEADRVAPHRVGDTAHYNMPDGSAATGEVVKVLKGGKVMVKDDATGAVKAVTPAEHDPLMDQLMSSIRDNNEAISKAAGRQQGGFISPTVLAHMASSQVGGAVGFMSADDDASMAEKLSLAGMGMLAGLGVHVGASKVLTKGEREFLTKAPAEVRSLAREEVANIAPRPVGAKAAPVIHQAKVEKLVEAAKEGGFQGLAKAVKEADFNFSHIDTAEDVKNTIDAFSSVFEKETSLAKHGSQSFDELKGLANELGSGEASLKELYQGTENLDARILAHRALLTASAEKVTQLSRLAMTGDADGILALRKQVALHASIQAQMKGIQTEVARALSQFRITSSSIDLAVNERNQLIEAMGGHAANIRFAQQLSDIANPAQLNAIIRKGGWARTQDALFEAWVNGALSAPATHATNFIGNSLVAIGSVAERGTAAMLGKVLRTGPGAVDRGEVTAHLFGMMEGLVDALKITKYGLDALKRSAGEAVTGNFGEADRIIRASSGEFGGAYRAFFADAPVLDNAAYGTKQFDLQAAAFSAERFGLEQQSIMGRVADGLGALLRTPGRFLTTSDELFKTIHYRGELKAQAYREARARGAEGDELTQRIAALIEDPTPEMRAQALSAARTGTFTSPLGKTGGAVQSIAANTPGLRYIMPFVRTPTNIMKYVGARTPGLNMLSSNVRAEFAAGGARRDMMLAKTTLGGSLYAVAAYLTAQGYIVGGGDKDSAAERLNGEQPYSVKAGDTYYSFSRLDPLGMMLGLAADITDISGHLDDTETEGLASAAVLAVSRNLMSKTYLSGVVNLLDAITQQDGKLEKFMEGMAGSFVPMSGLTNTIRKETDPTVKEVWSMMDAVKAKVPGWSKEVPPQVNLFGDDVVYKGGLGPDIASPIATSSVSTEPAANEIARLNIDLKHPPRTVGGGNGSPGVELTPQQYYRFTKLIGNAAKVGGKGFKDYLNELVQSDHYKNLPEDPSNTVYQEAKEKTIRVVYERYKRFALQKLLEEDADLKGKFYQNLQNTGNALMGRPIQPF